MKFRKFKRREADEPSTDSPEAGHILFNMKVGISNCGKSLFPSEMVSYAYQRSLSLKSGSDLFFCI